MGMCQKPKPTLTTQLASENQTSDLSKANTNLNEVLSLFCPKLNKKKKLDAMQGKQTGRALGIMLLKTHAFQLQVNLEAPVYN